MSSISLADFVESLKYVHDASSGNPWEAFELHAGCGAPSQYEELGPGTIAPFSTLLSADSEEVQRLDSTNSRIGAGDLKSSRGNPIDHIGMYPETAMHSDAYWFDEHPSVGYEGYVLESAPVYAERNVMSQLLALDMDLCSNTEYAEDPPLDYRSSSIGLESETTATNEPEPFSDEQSANSEFLGGCEPNMIRSPSDMYTPRWMRGMGKAKEGLCPICYNNGELNWKRMKCSAYWYHLNYFHGVSSLTGRPFPKPQAMRMVQAGSGKQRQQGQCHICLEWVDTASTRKVRVNVPEIYWWKHIQACIKRTWDE